MKNLRITRAIAIVVSKGFLLAATVALLVTSVNLFATSASGATQPLPVTLNSPNSTTQGYFGGAIAISGNLLAMGAPYEGYSPFYGDLGHVYVYNETSGAFITTLIGPAYSEGSFAGGNPIGRPSVSISGDLVAVGVYLANGNAGGVAYVYNAISGSLISNLTSPNEANNGGFGYSVAMSGDLLAVGAPFETSNGLMGNGNAYVYNATSGALVRNLTNPITGPQCGNNGLTCDNFGDSIAISGDLVVVGAAGGEGNKAYVFNATSGALVSTLSDPNSNSGAYFGQSTSISGTLVAVGAWAEFSGEGRAYVFNALTGSLISTLANPDTQEYANFGNSVAISGQIIAVGAVNHGYYLTANNVQSYTGGAYVFNSSSGTLISDLQAPNPLGCGPHEDLCYGTTVATNGNSVAVGAPAENSTCGVSEAGRAYIFPVPYSVISTSTISTSTATSCSVATSAATSTGSSTTSSSSSSSSNSGSSSNSFSITQSITTATTSSVHATSSFVSTSLTSSSETQPTSSSRPQIATSTTEVSTTTTNHGVPEFPYSMVIVAVFTLLVAGSYLVIRRRYVSRKSV